eukprot:TRINITY_DN13413_c0_g2_i1.p1 TRINITY_DN13413_c0_g2~~TRINITY_DN13413_c0_g2_i1.p1  ORF type:complete len:300 (-),score=60.93 TRINITY_DN13413_c0_g2_i1:40-939(-)
MEENATMPDIVGPLLEVVVDIALNMMLKLKQIQNVTQEDLADIWTSALTMSSNVTEIVSKTEKAKCTLDLEITTKLLLKQLLELIKAIKANSDEVEDHQQQLFSTIDFWKQEAKAVHGYLSKIKRKTLLMNLSTQNPWGDFDFDRYKAYGGDEKPDPARIKTSYHFHCSVTNPHKVVDHIEYSIKVTTDHPVYQRAFGKEEGSKEKAEFAITRRYTEFMDYYGRMKGVAGAARVSLPVMPGRTFLWNESAEVLDERTRAFDLLMYVVSQNESMYTSKVTRDFLSPGMTRLLSRTMTAVN